MPEPQTSSLTGETCVQADGEHQKLQKRLGRLLEFFFNPIVSTQTRGQTIQC